MRVQGEGYSEYGGRGRSRGHRGHDVQGKKYERCMEVTTGDIHQRHFYKGSYWMKSLHTTILKKPLEEDTKCVSGRYAEVQDTIWLSVVLDG